MLIDTHCHLTDDRLAEEVDEIVASMRTDGLEALVTVGYDIESSLKGAELALKYDAVYCSVGIHPHDAVSADTDAYAAFSELATRHGKVVAIGEIGLDYFYDLSPRDVQQRAFAEQLELAHECGLPVILHVRDAYEDSRKILFDNRRYLDNGVLLHCYSGSAEMVKVFSALDAYYAFGGAITFKNAKHNLEALRVVPRDRLLVETDSPYMTPVPYRGKTNFPKYVSLVAEKAAEVLETDRAEIEEITTKNAKTLFKRIK